MSKPNSGEFLWGVATSAYQIEGGIQNDHNSWNRSRLPVHRHPQVLEAGIAADHWNRWDADFDLLPQLGVNSYRFSIEWARLEPEPGRFNDAAFAAYRRMIDSLLARGITPMVTLHHFTHPAWFHKLSPWHEASSIDRFQAFVEEVDRRLLKQIPYVITFNEPLVWLLAGYGDAKFPPFKRNLKLLMECLRNMLLAHRRAYDYLKARHPEMQIGIAHNMIVFQRARPDNILDGELKRRLHRFYNLMIPRALVENRLKYSFPFLLNYDQTVPLDNRIDFWGVNYYYRLHVRFRFRPFRPFDMYFVPRSKYGLSGLGWEIYPRGLYKACRWLRFTGKPLIITENGIATNDDALRVRFLDRHLMFLKRLRDEGALIQGYYHWSLLDNFEWLIGTDARFGLVHVDYSNGLERALKPSGKHFANLISMWR